MTASENLAVIADTPMPGANGAVLRTRLVKGRAGPELDVRVFTPFTAAQTLFPTGRGVSLPLSILPALAPAIAEAEDKARELGLIGGVE